MTVFLYKPPANTSLKWTIKTKIKEAIIKTNTPFWLKKFFFQCGKSSIRQQRIFYWWIFCQRLNSLPHRSSFFMFKKFITTRASEFGSAWEEQNVLATQKNQIACSKSNSLLFLGIFSKIPSIKIFLKSEAWKRLSFVCNNKPFRTKNKKRQTVDAWMKCATPETDESTSRKNNILWQA